MLAWLGGPHRGGSDLGKAATVTEKTRHWADGRLHRGEIFG